MEIKTWNFLSRYIDPGSCNGAGLRTRQEHLVCMCLCRFHPFHCLHTAQRTAEKCSINSLDAQCSALCARRHPPACVSDERILNEAPPSQTKNETPDWPASSLRCMGRPIRSVRYASDSNTLPCSPSSNAPPTSHPRHYRWAFDSTCGWNLEIVQPWRPLSGSAIHRRQLGLGLRPHLDRSLRYRMTNVIRHEAPPSRQQ